LYFQTSDPQRSDKTLGGLGYLPKKTLECLPSGHIMESIQFVVLISIFTIQLTCQMAHDGTRMKNKFFQLTALSAAVKLSWLPVCKHQISARAGHASAMPSRCHPAAPRQST